MKVEELKQALGDDWLPTLYRDRVRSDRTRAHVLDIPRRANNAEIQYTLLGIELKVGRRRFACPDLATARYMRVFARIGCRDLAVPYDISRIPAIADELETAWQRTQLLLEQRSKGDILAADRSVLTKMMRTEIEEIGPGEPMPLFDRETKQRGKVKW